MERVSGPSRYVYDFLHGLAEYNRLRTENKRLRFEVAQLRRDLNRYREESLENVRLRSLLRMKNAVPGEFIVARVVGYDVSSWRACITVDRGLKDGIRPDSVVLAGGGVAGRILNSTIHYSRVMLVTDRNSRIPVLVQRSRVMGILEGAGHGLCTLSYVEKDADVIQGDKVVTSGMGGYFPKGLLVGTVVKVEENPRDNVMFQSIEVRPIVELKRLEELLIRLDKDRTLSKR